MKNLLAKPLLFVLISTLAAFSLLSCSEDVELPDNKVPEIDADIIITMVNNSSSAWRVVSVTNLNGTALENIAETNLDNPEITFQVGKRYFVKNNGGGSHPFEIVGASGVLLSEFAPSDGSFEGDAEVDFETNEDGIIFSFTQDLSEATTGYQCASHPQSMFGPIVLDDEPSDEPDVIITMINSGSSAWHVDSIDGEGASASIHANNTTITLNQGLRYQFIVNAPNHPFQLIDVANAVLVSGESGSFHDVAEVNYVKSGNSFTFTLTQDLADAINRYRCGIHTGSMVGNITIN